MKKRVTSYILMICIFGVILSGCTNSIESLENEGQVGEIVVSEADANAGTENSQENVDLSENSDLSVAQVGDVVKFGRYEQDDNFENGAEPIEWIVLDEQDGKLLLISKYALESLPFDTTSGEEITWENCTLRTWLNDSFYKDAFAVTEQEQICLTEIATTVFYVEDTRKPQFISVVENDYHFSYESYKEPYIKKFEQLGTTKDNVFLLDYDDLVKYMNLRIIQEESSYTYDGDTVPFSYSGLKAENFTIMPTAWAEKWGMGRYLNQENDELDGFILTNDIAWWRTSAFVEWEDKENGKKHCTAALFQDNGWLNGCTHLTTPGYIYPAMWVEK